MTNKEKYRKKLLKKLSELFQLDQPDLDFGFYRIMQAKAEQVKSFIDEDLLQIIEDAFGQVDENRKAELTAAIDSAIEQAKKFGAPDPENSGPVKEARAQYDALKDGASAESDVYDHLYRFFERYYDEGDFISRRYYARENAGKAAPFAIPYNGEEVKLHWANADQYYIKTAEYFSNYSFDMTQAIEIRNMSEDEKVVNKIPQQPLKVHFRIVDASEGEHGNVKAAEDKKRFFVLHEDNPVEFNDAEELIINFEYKALPGGKNDVDADTAKVLTEKYGDRGKTGTAKPKLDEGSKPNLAIAEKIIEALLNPQISQMDADEKSEKSNLRESPKSADEYLKVLQLAAPTDKIPNRPLLAKYINQYTARNTCDYFIHKDLSGFLKRELDFYIKNEVMHLDDIENADAPAVENYLAKLKVIRKIATKLIDFLAQLEDFQKKLWLKKKFVTKTNYCITLDRIPEDLYEEIAANDEQREEWVKLFAIDEIKGDAGGLPGMGSPAYSVPMTTDFLKANDKLVLDTAFFSADFKAKLIASIEGFDEQCDGLLIHSENFQALNLIKTKHKSDFQCIYIDPPYNAKSSEILYKNTFKHSSFLSFLHNRIGESSELLSQGGLINVAIDDYEHRGTLLILDDIFTNENFISNVVVQHNPRGRNDDKFYGTSHEYMIVYTNDTSSASLGLFDLNESDKAIYNKKDQISAYHEVSFMRTGNNSDRHTRPNLFYPIYVNIEGGHYSLEPIKGYIKTLPVNSAGEEKTWRWGKETFLERCKTEVSFRNTDEGVRLFKKRRLEGAGKKPKTIWHDSKYDASSSGIMFLRNYFGKNNDFSYPKSIYTVQDALKISCGINDKIIDFFAGSGTTGHAVINLNREDGGTRNYTLIEMGQYFDTVTKPRITKVIYSSEWKNGKPTSRDTGISQCFKYIRLESYEDTLNNLVFDKNPIRGKAIKSNPSLKEDYMLRYLLNVETRGSQSLLNIDAFADPCAYALVVKKPGSDEQVTQHIDLIETFNYLLGLRLENMAAPQTFTAGFTRKPDPELPEDQHTKLVVDGKIQQADDGKWWFRKLEGWVPADSMNPNNGQKERVLIVWRKLTGNLEEDNLMLDEWFEKYRISTRDFEYDTIYVNGSNNLPNLKKDDENWKVRLIEEEFHKKMWEAGNE